MKWGLVGARSDSNEQTQSNTRSPGHRSTRTKRSTKKEGPRALRTARTDRRAIPLLGPVQT